VAQCGTKTACSIILTVLIACQSYSTHTTIILLRSFPGFWSETPRPPSKSKDEVPCLLNPGTRWSDRSASCSGYFTNTERASTTRRIRWDPVSVNVTVKRKILPCQKSNPNHLTHSKSLYWQQFYVLLVPSRVSLSLYNNNLLSAIYKKLQMKSGIVGIISRLIHKHIQQYSPPSQRWHTHKGQCRDKVLDWWLAVEHLPQDQFIHHIYLPR
jgi:hypothetical protein